jgi:PRTRC genetic system ParB family protein
MNAVVPLTGAIAPIVPVPVAGDTAAVYLPVDVISPRPGFNPREFFDPQEFLELVESVRKDGVVQPIVVRPYGEPGHYQIVAGERRWRACREAGVQFIPAVIRELDDRQALRIAATENGPRVPLSASEEALLVRRMLELHEGDQARAREELNWEPRKFDARRLLLHAVPAVLSALSSRKIELGHAELISPLHPEKQTFALKVTIEHKLTVAQLREHILRFALDLATACFDLEGCRDCPHNTTRQSSLFGQNIGEGQCANPPCFREKTLAHVQELRKGLNDAHAMVRLDIEQDASAYNVLLRQDVGPEQYETGCAQCQFFGCVVSSGIVNPGQITQDVCFNPPCREQKMADYLALLSDKEETADPEAAQAPMKGETSPSAKRPAPTKKKRKATVSAAGVPRKVREFVEGVHRRAAGVEVRGNPKMAKVYAVMALLSELSALGISRSAEELLKSVGVERDRHSDPRVRLIGPLHQLEPAALDQLAQELAARIAEREGGGGLSQPVDYLKGSQVTLAVLSARLERHFLLDGKFLETHTKAGIRGVLQEAKFDAWYTQKKSDPKAFERLFSERHEVIVKRVMDSGFDFTGFVPRIVRLSAG